MLPCLSILTLAHPEHAEAQARLHISVESNADGCGGEQALRKRVLHYLTRTVAHQPMSVRVSYDNGAVQFVVSRAGADVSQRRFAQLPETCADRRDALALAIALAIEHVSAEQHDASDVEPAQHSSRQGQVDARERVFEVAHAPGRTAKRGRVTSEAETAEADEEPVQPSADRTSEEAPPTLPTARAASSQESAAGDTAAPAAASSLGRERVVAATISRAAAAGNPATAPRAPRHDASKFGERAPGAHALHGGVRLLLEVLPVHTLAFSAGGDLTLASFFSLRLSGLVSLREQAALGPGRVRAQLLAAEALGCGHADVASLRLLGCLGGAGGALRALGEGYADDLPVTLGWFAALARIAARWSFTRVLAAQLNVGGHLNVVRPELRLVGSAQTRMSRLPGGSLGLDMIVALR